MKLTRRTMISSAATACAVHAAPRSGLRKPDAWMPRLSENLADVKPQTLRWLKQLGCATAIYQGTDDVDRDPGSLDVEYRVHFLALCSRIIRQILVDHARGRNYAKRGGSAVKVTLDDTIPSPQPRDIEVLALNQALESLAKIDQRKVRVIELRYFGGLNFNETAAVLGISVETAKRDWRMAKALLRLALSKGGE